MKFNIPFIKNRKIFFIIAAVFVVIGILSMIIRGFYWDVDFAGGTEITYSLGTGTAVSTTDTSAVESAARGVVGDKISVIQASDGDTVILKSLELTLDERENIANAIKESYENASVVETNNVSANVSNDLRRSAIMATCIAVALMLLYITIRFQFSSALAAVACLCHDIFIVLSAYSIFQIPVSSSVIAVLLTILGYSINATIIIFDRIRENVRIIKNATFEEKVNTSVNQTLMRSINTTLTTLFTIGMIYILGVQSIKEFAFPLIVGIFAGLYSSVCLAGSFWTIFKRKNERIK